MSTPDPIWVRDSLVESYRRTADRNGVSPTSAQLEAIANEDLRIHDAVVRESKPSPVRKADPRREPSSRVVKLANSLGYDLVKKDVIQRKAGTNHAAFLGRPPKTDKQAKALLRLSRILSQRSAVRLSREADFEMPALAQRFVSMVVDLKEHRGAFLGMSPKDCERIFWADLFDICDKSTGKLGSWYVK